MTIVIGILTFLAGIGFGAGGLYYFHTSKQNDTKNKNLEATIKNVLANHAKLHIDETRTLVENIEKQCQAISSQLTHYEATIESESEEKSGPGLEYFSEQESTYLRHSKLDTREKDRKKATDQPRDYAATGSGLFVGKKDDNQESTKQD